MDLQRARIVGAMVELVRERGVGAVTVAQVVERSGVSRRTFYEHFQDREDCFVAALDHAIGRLAARVLPAYRVAGPGWRERMRAGLGALLEAIDGEPSVGALCVVDAPAGGRAALECRARAVRVLVDAVHEGRREVVAARKPGRLTAEGLVGAVSAVVHARLLGRERRPLAGLLNPLMGMIVLPYLGSEAAEREQAHRRSRARRDAPLSGAAAGVSAVGDPLRDLGMRVTYRTVQVLLAIADLAGEGSSPSSRQVADAAGVGDQGQMSKLMRRLEHLGLIANSAPVTGRGKPNAWRLTQKGHAIEQAIRSQTGG